MAKRKPVPPKKKRGPYKPIDPKKVESCAAYMACETEIARMCDVGYTTWKRQKKENPEIAEAIERGREKGRFSLRMAQMKSALAGNTHMLKWCGMQYLGQKHAMQHGNDPVNPMPANRTEQVITFASAEEAAAARDAYIRESRAKLKK